MILYGMIISGFGGQGILTLGKMFALAAMKDNLNVTYYPSYGAEVRGGTAHCGVIFSDEAIASPIVYEADALLALNEPSLKKFLPRLKKDGFLVCNSSLISPKYLKNNGKQVCSIPATEVARELDIEKATNMVIAGCFFKHFSLVKQDSFLQSLLDVFPKITQKLHEKNITAFERGLNHECSE